MSQFYDKGFSLVLQQNVLQKLQFYNKMLHFKKDMLFIVIQSDSSICYSMVIEET